MPRTRGTAAILSECRWATRQGRWRNRAEFVGGREQIQTFLARKWARELDYRLIKDLWTYTSNRIAVRLAYKWHDDSGNWFRSYGNENWEFDPNGLMRRRHACINDLPIKAQDRLLHLAAWSPTRRSSVAERPRVVRPVLDRFCNEASTHQPFRRGAATRAFR